MTKSDLLQHVLQFLNSKIEFLQNDLEGLRAELSDNTKSTAGDKHETSRAMAQLEMEKLGKQHLETQKMIELANRLMSSPAAEHAQLGSLVLAGNQFYLLGLPLGKVEFEGKSIFCISLQSPVGQKLLKAKVNDMITLPMGKVKVDAVL